MDYDAHKEWRDTPRHERRMGYQPRYSVSPWKVLKVGAVIVALVGLVTWAIEHIARHM